MRAIILCIALIAECKKMYMSCDNYKCTLHDCAVCQDGYSTEETEFGKLCFKFYAENLDWEAAV